MNPERLKQLRQSWATRRGRATVHALIDALEAADRAVAELTCEAPSWACTDAQPCFGCHAIKLYDAAKARI